MRGNVGVLREFPDMEGEGVRVVGLLRYLFSWSISVNVRVRLQLCPLDVTHTGLCSLENLTSHSKSVNLPPFGV